MTAKHKILVGCCFVILMSAPSVAYAQSNGRPSFAPPPPSFQSQIYSRSSFASSLAIASGSESARLKSELYAINPFSATESNFNSYLNVVDELVRIRAVIENEATSRKSNRLARFSGSNGNGMAFDAHMIALVEKVENERMAALLDKVELLKRQVVFAAKQLRDDLGAEPSPSNNASYASSFRSRFTSSYASSLSDSSSRTARNLEISFRKKFDVLINHLKKDCIALDALYQNRLSSITTSGESLKSQMRSTVGSNKVSEGGTTMHVRNYVNFGGVDQSQGNLTVPAMAPPASLMAVPGKLGNPASRRPLRSRP
ncbi:MAG: hypothetical protein Q8T09_16965 [Candidatus Melainabacteria bacterium]|nr:hypothetical protein [Candidatus Melainabacteria bacterium]